MVPVSYNIENVNNNKKSRNAVGLVDRVARWRRAVPARACRERPVRMLNHVARLAHEVGNAMLLPQVPGEARRVRSCLLGGYLFCSGSIIGSGRLTKRYLGLFRVCSGRIA